MSSQQEQQTQIGNNSSTASGNLSTYNDHVFGIQMEYPSDWIKLDLSGNTSSSSLIAFRSPIGSPAGSLNIIAESFKLKNLTFSQFADANINFLKQSGKNLNLTSSGPYSLAGNAAHKVEYTTISPRGIPFKAMQIFSLISNKAYFITYTAPSENYAIHLPTIGTMINSLKISK